MLRGFSAGKDTKHKHSFSISVVLVGISLLSKVMKASGENVKYLLSTLFALLLVNSVSIQMFEIRKLNSYFYP